MRSLPRPAGGTRLLGELRSLVVALVWCHARFGVAGAHDRDWFDVDGLGLDRPRCRNCRQFL